MVEISLKQAVKKAEKMLEEAGVSLDNKRDARLLLYHVLNCDGAYFLLNQDAALDLPTQYFELVKRRCAREPLCYITQKAEFMSLDFFVEQGVLVPRQDTEILVESVISTAADMQNPRILDLCTGSGCIAVSLAKYIANSSVYAVDVSNKALEIAEKNATANGVCVTFIHQNLLTAPLRGSYDIIVSNPPYIESGVINTLEDEVRCFEPSLALDGGEDGMIFYNRLVPMLPGCLLKGGFVALETGFDQARKVADLMDASGFCDVKTIADYGRRDRVVIGRR